MTEQEERNWQRFDELFVDEHPMLGDIKDWMLPPFSESDLRKQEESRIRHEEQMEIWRQLDLAVENARSRDRPGPCQDRLGSHDGRDVISRDEPIKQAHPIGLGCA